MTDCCSNPPNIGKWLIYVRIPIYYPPRVVFNWNDGSNYQQIEGDDYIISSQLNSNSNVYYHVTIKQSWYSRNLIDGYINGPWTPLDDVRFLTRYNILGKIGILSYYDNNPYNVFGLYYNNNNSFWGLVSGYQTTHYPILPSYVTTAAQHEIVSIVRVDTGTEDKSYTLKIFKNKSQVYEETRSTNPTVQLKPEQCLQNEQKTFVREFRNYKSKDYCYQTIRENQANLFLLSEQFNGTFASVLLAYESSDERCSLAPIFEVDCIPCKKCPDNTCELICGDMVCCYEQVTGQLIDSFSISELCG